LGSHVHSDIEPHQCPTYLASQFTQSSSWSAPSVGGGGGGGGVVVVGLCLCVCVFDRVVLTIRQYGCACNVAEKEGAKGAERKEGEEGEERKEGEEEQALIIRIPTNSFKLEPL
jgi:hypothetical protein